jgi:hypothetical protein
MTHSSNTGMLAELTVNPHVVLPMQAGVGAVVRMHVSMLAAARGLSSPVGHPIHLPILRKQCGCTVGSCTMCTQAVALHKISSVVNIPSALLSALGVALH